MESSPLRMMSLCTGIGGFDYVWRHVLGQEIAGQVEIDPFCNAVLEMQFPDVPRLKDIRDVRGDEFGLPIHVVAGGIPCQPWSVAGQQRGARDDRHLWPAMRRIVQVVRPAWVVIENVAGFASLALDDVCTDLEFMFYEVTAFMVPAGAVQAPHLRERIFIVAHTRYTQRAGWDEVANGSSRERDEACHVIASRGGDVAHTRDGQCERAECISTGWHTISKPDALCATGRCSQDVVHANGTGLQGRGTPTSGKVRSLSGAVARHGRDGQTQSRVGGVLDGLSTWLDGHRWPAGPSDAQYEWEAPRAIRGSTPNQAHRLKALGNAVVPAQVAPILAGIIEAHWTYYGNGAGYGE